MNRIESYVNAVKDYLPEKSREDVAEELASLLEEEKEAKEVSLGRPMEDGELLDWLREKPHPVLAAAGYGEKQALIGEASFPLYKQFLKYFLLILAGYLALISGLQVVSQGEYHLSGLLSGLLSSFIGWGLQGMAVITLVFYFFEKHFSAKRWYGDWDPDKLPARKENWQSISYVSSAFAIALTLVFAAWINGILPEFNFPRDRGGPFELSWSPEIRGWLLPFNGIILVTLVLSLSQLLRPYWQRWSLIVNGLLAFLTAWVLWELSRIQPIVLIEEAEALSPERLERMTGLLNGLCRNAFRIAALVNLFEGLRDIYRLYKIRRSG